MDLSSRFPAKKAGHFPIDEAHNLVIINYTVGNREVVVHEAHIWIFIGVREEHIVFKGWEVANSGIRSHVRPTPRSIGRLDGVQLSKYISCLLSEGL